MLLPDCTAHLLLGGSCVDGGAQASWKRQELGLDGIEGEGREVGELVDLLW